MASKYRASFRALRLSLAAAGALALSACGFAPMYGSHGIANGLSDIRIETGQERVDFLLQEALHDRLGSRHAAGNLRLVTETESTSTGLGLGADAIASRFAVQVRVEYRLFDERGDAQPIASGRVVGEAGYDVNTEVYNTVAAERDAEERAARVAADRLVSQLARAVQNRETR